MFDRIGVVHYPADAASAEEMFEAALEAGATDVTSDESGHEISCAPDDLSTVRDGLEKHFGPADAARLDWRSNVTVDVDEDAASALFKLLDALDDNDDVQRVASNFDVAEDVLERLSA
jgi:transcriptional/translational regulatory protein YebC/TACO1